MFYIAT